MGCCSSMEASGGADRSHHQPMLRFALDLLPSLLVGLALGWRFPALPSRLAGPLVHWGIPLTLVGLLLRSGLGRELLATGWAAALITSVGLLAVSLLGPLRRALAQPALRLGAAIGNTGYFGIPVALALLPPRALGHSITYDLVGTLITWSIGPLLIEGRAPTARRLLAFLAGSPAVRGLALALAIHATPWSAAVAGLLWLPARAVLLLALATVGMRLGVMLRSPDETDIAPGEAGSLISALAFKLLLLPGLALAITPLLGLDPLIRLAVVLQAAAPTAVSALLLAEAAGRDQARTAHLVLWSTALALASVPGWWWLVGRSTL